jgi:transcriptional regulator with XRE-family HTH domain
VVANRIQELIMRLKITQAGFASEIKTTPAAVSQYLSGEREPQTEVILKICKRFGVTSDWLLGIDKYEQEHVSAIGYFSCCNCDSRFKIVGRE